MNIKRGLSLLLAGALAVGLCTGGGPLAVTASAIDAEEPYREFREEADESFRPMDWVEETITCQSGPDTLAGTLTRPSNVDDGVPVAILLHGLSTNSRWCDDIAWFLAGEGIASVRFDFAGTGFSTGAQEHMTVGSEVINTIDIIDYVKSLDFTDTDNIFLVGKSMGGVDAVLASQLRSSDIRAMCLWYPGFGIGDAVRHGFLLGETFDTENLPQTLTAAGYTYGQKFLEEAGKLDCTEACRSYNRPVMILHGDQDFVAPIEYSFRMSEVFPDCTMKVVPGGYHGFWGYQELGALIDMTEFLKANMV